MIGRTLTCSLVDYSTTIVNAGVYGASFDGCSQPSAIYDESRFNSYCQLLDVAVNVSSSQSLRMSAAAYFEG